MENDKNKIHNAIKEKMQTNATKSRTFNMLETGRTDTTYNNFTANEQQRQTRSLYTKTCLSQMNTNQHQHGPSHP